MDEWKNKLAYQRDSKILYLLYEVIFSCNITGYLATKLSEILKAFPLDVRGGRDGVV